jgi:predicted DNA-binding transcriptional regulator YafY
MDNRIAVIKSAEQNTIIDKNVPLIMRSLTGKEALQITYTEFDPNTTQAHIIEPIGIINENGIWNTIAYNNDTETYRHFRIDRIAQIRLIGKSFSQNHLSLKAYVDAQKKKEIIYKPIIKIKKEAAHFIEEQKYKYGYVREKENENSIEMEFETTCLQTFSRWFLTIADNAKIVEPNELKTLFKLVVTDISKNL